MLETAGLSEILGVGLSVGFCIITNLVQKQLPTGTHTCMCDICIHFFQITIWGTTLNSEQSIHIVQYLQLFKNSTHQIIGQFFITFYQVKRMPRKSLKIILTLTRSHHGKVHEDHDGPETSP